MRKTEFWIDGLKGTFEGYDSGINWNGFPVPIFDDTTLHVIKVALDDANAKFGEVYEVLKKSDSGSWQLVQVENGTEPEYAMNFIPITENLFQFPLVWCWEEVTNLTETTK
jgi:hypothetical protein